MTGGTAIAQQAVLDTIAHLMPDYAEGLKKRLAHGAACGLIDAADIDTIVDNASYASISNDAVIADICAQRQIVFNPEQWDDKHPKAKAAVKAAIKAARKAQKAKNKAAKQAVPK